MLEFKNGIQKVMRGGLGPRHHSVLSPRADESWYKIIIEHVGTKRGPPRFPCPMRRVKLRGNMANTNSAFVDQSDSHLKRWIYAMSHDRSWTS